MVTFLAMVIVAVAVVVLVMRAAGAGQGGSGSGPRPRRSGPPRVARRPVAPDDDPEFLRELERRSRRDDGSPA